MSTYVIGDIQGCHDEFMALLDHMGYRQGTDELWLVGDLINRGPDNVGVMDFVIDTPNITAVLGNHDLHFLAVARGHHRAHRSDTFEDLLANTRLEDYIAYLRNLPLLHHDRDRNTVMVHAGLPPQLDLTTCKALAVEVETVLKSDNFDEFLIHMYGNEPDTWDDSLTSPDRWRIITNYFTRLRYSKADGQLELTHKTDIQPEGFSPWYVFERGEPETILFGHWAALEGKADSSFAVPLDTGCVWGRSLTAIRLEDNQMYSVPAMNAAIES